MNESVYNLLVQVPLEDLSLYWHHDYKPLTEIAQNLKYWDFEDMGYKLTTARNHLGVDDDTEIIVDWEGEIFENIEQVKYSIKEFYGLVRRIE